MFLHCNKRKGLSLPVEVVVIVLIAIIVMAVVAAFFLFSGGGGIGNVKDNAALSKGCNILISAGCQSRDATSVMTQDISGYIVDGRQGKMSDACDRVLGTTAANRNTRCFEYCCGGTSSGGGGTGVGSRCTTASYTPTCSGNNLLTCPSGTVISSACPTGQSCVSTPFARCE